MSRIVVDMDKCTGHGRCYVVAPELFEDDDEGRPVILRPDVDGADKAKAEEAVAACPEAAIWLEKINVS